jgi:hypothetical protein
MFDASATTISPTFLRGSSNARCTKSSHGKLPHPLICCCANWSLLRKSTKASAVSLSTSCTASTNHANWAESIPRVFRVLSMLDEVGGVSKTALGVALSATASLITAVGFLFEVRGQFIWHLSLRFLSTSLNGDHHVCESHFTFFFSSSKFEHDRKLHTIGISVNHFASERQQHVCRCGGSGSSLISWWQD